MFFWDSLSNVLGLGVEPKDMGFLQVCLRGVVVFVSALIMVRLADRRFMSKMTAFDVILGFMLASALARAINGSAPLFPTLVMGVTLVLLHRLLAFVAMLSDKFGILVKGRENVLVQDGKLIQKAMRRNHISEKDLVEAARQSAKTEDLCQVRKAVLERSGKISVIKAEAS